MIYCLDTDILIEYFRGSQLIKRRIENLGDEDRIGLIWLTFYEFFKGIFVSGKLDEEKFLQNMAETCIILETSFEAARIGGQIYAALKKQGKLINDAEVRDTSHIFLILFRISPACRRQGFRHFFKTL